MQYPTMKQVHTAIVESGMTVVNAGGLVYVFGLYGMEVNQGHAASLLYGLYVNGYLNEVAPGQYSPSKYFSDTSNLK